MQRTRVSNIYEILNKLIFGFLKSKWKDKSINLITILFGYFLFANFITKFISEGQNELVMIPVIIVIVELIIRIKPTSKSSLYGFWSLIDKIRIGGIYALILEAFKLGS
tara:strand:+ start:276 stop:602 length:327 start_codon:yes stop_codon:yes gene_type:complete